MLKSFDRYVLREIASPFALGLVIYTFTLMINMIFELSSILIAKDASTITVLKILIYTLPDFLSFTIPMATLMGVLAGLSRMSTDSEVVAFRTMGVSNFRLLKPIMLFAVAGWLVSSWLIMYVTPEAGFRLNDLMDQVGGKRVASNLKPGKFYQEFPGYTLMFNDTDPHTNEWKDVFLYSRERSDTDILILAKKGRYVHNPGERNSDIVLEDATVHSFKRKSPQDSFEVAQYQFKKEKISNTRHLGTTRRGRHMVFPELVDRLQMEPHNVSLAIEYHRKFSLPFACLAMAFLALSLGISTKKGGKISGFIISLGVIFIYYSTSVSLENMVLKGSVSPFLGMWGADFFLLAVGLIMYYFSAKEKTINWERLFFFSTILKRRARKRQLKEKKKVVMVIRMNFLRIRFFKILDLYVIKKLLFTFFLAFSSILLIFYIISIIELIDDVIENKVAFIYVLKYAWHHTPEIVSFSIPVSVLTSVLLTFSMMSKNNEMVAVQVSGISLYRLTLPAILLGILLSGLYFYVQEDLMPDANRKKREILNVIHNREIKTDEEVDNNWVIGRDNVIYFFDFKGQNKSNIVKFNMIFLNKKFQVQKRVVAETARWVSNFQLSLEDGFERDFKNNIPTSYHAFESKTITIPEGQGFFVRRISFPQYMNIKNLIRYIAYLKEKKADTQKFEAKVYYNYAFPLASLMMVLIAVPFSFIMGNKGTLFGIGIAIAFSMVFWFSFAVFSALGAAAIVSPFMSGFAPLFIFGLVSVYLFLSIKT